MATTGDGQEERGRNWMEVVATLLLALAAVATAWSSYQAARWNGEQAKTGSQVNALRIEAARSQGLAEAQTEIDVALFFEWIDATAQDRSDLAQFYEDRFRDEFRTAFDAWVATDPIDDSTAPATPFAMGEYQLAAQADADGFDAEAETKAATVREDIQRSTNYVLAVVLFAVSLFFAGMSTKLHGRRARQVLLVVGSVVFVGTATWIATFPISIAV